MVVHNNKDSPSPFHAAAAAALVSRCETEATFFSCAVCLSAPSLLIERPLLTRVKQHRWQGRCGGLSAAAVCEPPTLLQQHMQQQQPHMQQQQQHVQQQQQHMQQEQQRIQQEQQHMQQEQQGIQQEQQHMQQEQQQPHYPREDAHHFNISSSAPALTTTAAAAVVSPSGAAASPGGAASSSCGHMTISFPGDAAAATSPELTGVPFPSPVGGIFSSGATDGIASSQGAHSPFASCVAAAAASSTPVCLEFSEITPASAAAVSAYIAVSLKTLQRRWRHYHLQQQYSTFCLPLLGFLLLALHTLSSVAVTISACPPVSRRSWSSAPHYYTPVTCPPFFMLPASNLLSLSLHSSEASPSYIAAALTNTHYSSSITVVPSLLPSSPFSSFSSNAAADGFKQKPTIKHSTFRFYFPPPTAAAAYSWTRDATLLHALGLRQMAKATPTSTRGRKGGWLRHGRCLEKEGDTMGGKILSNSNSGSYRYGRSQLHLVWGYPLFGDEPERKRRRKIDPAWERGYNRANIAWDYETANRIAQGIYYVKEEYSIHTEEEEGLGKSEGMKLSAEEAAGGSEIDANEVEKIKRVLPIVDRGDGVGVATLIGAKDGVFAFRYNGPMQYKFGFKQWLRYLITANYPGAIVKLITEVRKLVFWKKPYFYENELESYGPDPFGHVAVPQPIR